MCNNNGNTSARDIFLVLRESIAETMAEALGLLPGSAASNRVTYRDVRLHCPVSITAVEGTSRRRARQLSSSTLTVTTSANFTTVFRELSDSCSSSQVALSACASSSMATFVSTMNNASASSGGGFLRRFVANVARSALNTTVLDGAVLGADPVLGWGAQGNNFVYEATAAPTFAPTVAPKVYEVHVFYVAGAALAVLLFIGAFVYCCCVGTHPNKRKINAIVTDI